EPDLASEEAEGAGQPPVQLLAAGEMRPAVELRAEAEVEREVPTPPAERAEQHRIDLHAAGAAQRLRVAARHVQGRHEADAVVEEEPEDEAEMLRHQRPLDDEPAGGPGRGHEALRVEAVGARGAGKEEQQQTYTEKRRRAHGAAIILRRIF